MNIAILGATGSIGGQTLDVVRTCLHEARVKVLTGNRNIATLADQILEFKPEIVWVPDGAAADSLVKILDQKSKASDKLLRNKAQSSTKFEILVGEDELIACAEHDNVDIVVNALVGKVGLGPTFAAIRAGKNIALANKESLVTAGELIMRMARERGVRIVPIDSEHSAILQCLQGNLTGNADTDIINDANDTLAKINRSLYKNVEKIILTASGGPFRTWPKSQIEKATAADALRHPNWQMGPKITIDSATLMNKGLELIEAMWLFDQPLSNVEILVHPQSIIHSMVQLIDGTVMAQMGLPDMRLPILYALAGPTRVANDYPRMDFLTAKSLTFEPPDPDRFPCLSLAQHAAIVGGTLPAVMNAINEWAVGQFLNNKIDFYGISALIAEAFGSYTVKDVNSLSDIREAEAWAEEFYKKFNA